LDAALNRLIGPKQAIGRGVGELFGGNGESGYAILDRIRPLHCRTRKSALVD
jgi:hypothetical protein